MCNPFNENFQTVEFEDRRKLQLSITSGCSSTWTYGDWVISIPTGENFYHFNYEAIHDSYDGAPDGNRHMYCLAITLDEIIEAIQEIENFEVTS